MVENNKETKARSIVKSYVNSMAPEGPTERDVSETPNKLTASNAGKPVNAVAKKDDSSAETKKLQQQYELMSKALTKLSEQQNASAKTLQSTQTENRELQKVCNSLKASHSTLKAGNDELNKANVQLKKKLESLEKVSETKLTFERLAQKNKE